MLLLCCCCAVLFCSARQRPATSAAFAGTGRETLSGDLPDACLLRGGCAGDETGRDETAIDVTDWCKVTLGARQQLSKRNASERYSTCKPAPVTRVLRGLTSPCTASPKRPAQDLASEPTAHGTVAVATNFRGRGFYGRHRSPSLCRAQARDVSAGRCVQLHCPPVAAWQASPTQTSRAPLHGDPRAVRLSQTDQPPRRVCVPAQSRRHRVTSPRRACNTEGMHLPKRVWRRKKRGKPRPRTPHANPRSQCLTGRCRR